MWFRPDFVDIRSSLGRLSKLQIGSSFERISLNQIYVVFEERGKPEYPVKSLWEQRREQTNSAHMLRPVW